jgi:hypothetical protein
MKRESLSLEDIFLKLTTDEPVADSEHAKSVGNGQLPVGGDALDSSPAAAAKTEVDSDA